ncbi:ABC transporter ATP-binding protein/permease [Eubacteriales bacterium OttesenSCG-928-N14]|nr:ABC transporter ATP-binding protein/permease [Eubacteriales bacterium OttesenSCG-928-N14]
MQAKKLSLFGDVMKGKRLRFALAIVFVALEALSSFFPQQVMRYTVDAVIGGESFPLPGFLQDMIDSIGGVAHLLEALWICALAYVLCSVVRGIFRFMQGYLTHTASETSIERLRNKIYDHLQNLTYKDHVDANSGDLLQRSSSDVETVRRFIAVQITEISRSVFLLGFALVIMLNMHVGMTFISLAVAPVLIVYSYTYFKRVRTDFLKTDEAEGRLSTVLQENLAGMRVVRAFGQQKNETDKFEKSSLEFQRLNGKLLDLLANYWGLTDLLIYIQQGITLVVGVILTLNGEMSIGTLMSFTSYTNMMLWPMRQMGRMLADAGKMQVSLGRISEILAVPEEADKPNAVKPDIKGRVEFKNVTFGYDDGPDILEDINFTVEPGETVAILGGTGSGKTSLVHLLQRLYPVRSGQVLIDGVDVADMDRKCLRKHVGLVLQEPFLYSRSIRANIMITRPEAAEREMIYAAKVANIDMVDEQFEQGYDTMVGERGVTLSGGQKQRVAIARMLMQNAPIIVFDDSLSALDTETDAAIRGELKRMQNKATTFIISHRINTLSEADKILVLENGRISQMGSHEQLVNEEGLYRRIWQLQGALEEQEKQVQRGEQ